MIKFTTRAMELLVKGKVKELFITLRYVEGPCEDNLCRKIPKVVVLTEREKDFTFQMIFEGFVKVYAIPPIVKTIEKHDDNVLIKVSTFGRKFLASGITYSF